MDKIVFGDRILVHNSNKWQVRTNRHTETNGNSWGWIEGPTENATWSNSDVSKNLDLAILVAKTHNEWLENQRPIDLRISEARDEVLKAEYQCNRARGELSLAEKRHEKILLKYADLIKLRQ